MTRIGRMNKKIIIKTVDTASDGFGGNTEDGTFTTIATVWAKVKPLTGFRALQFGQIVGNKPYEIEFNYQKSNFTVNEQNVLEFESKNFAVHSVIEINEDRKIIKILAYEQV